MGSKKWNDKPDSDALYCDTPPNDEIPRFTHIPLDRSKASIRLVQLCPDLSPEGYIQCKIRESTIDDRYFCVSYVWRGADIGMWVLVNSQAFWTRINLWNFLKYSRHQSQDAWLWIDGFCIDQNNVNERNHQVQQMGSIFSRAEGVISWLGDDERIAKVFEDQTDDRPILKANFEAFCSLDYWKRAWITQEVTLARRVLLMARDRCLPMHSLPWSEWKAVPLHRAMCWRVEPLIRSQMWNLKGRRLVYLLHVFGGKTCREQRDRVFALLALSGDGFKIEVDYRLSLEDLAQYVLRRCEQPLSPCSIRIIGRALGLGDALGLDDTPYATSTTAHLPFGECIGPLSHIQDLQQCTEKDYMYQGTVSYDNGPPKRSWSDKRTAVWSGSFVVRLQDLCDCYEGYLVIDTNIDASGVHLQHVPQQDAEHNGSSSEYFLQHRDHGIRIACSPDQRYCRVQFSFYTLMTIAWLFKPAKEPCKLVSGNVAVHGLGEAGGRERRTPILRFCES